VDQKAIGGNVNSTLISKKAKRIFDNLRARLYWCLFTREMSFLLLKGVIIIICLYLGICHFLVCHTFKEPIMVDVKGSQYTILKTFQIKVHITESFSLSFHKCFCPVRIFPTRIWVSSLTSCLPSRLLSHGHLHALCSERNLTWMKWA
jgi:hypothetical protein